jgi:hypothetical protein
MNLHSTETRNPPGGYGPRRYLGGSRSKREGQDANEEVDDPALVAAAA